MFEFRITAEEAQQKRLKYLKVLYIISFTIPVIYFFKFNFEYKVHQYNTILISMWLALVVIPPFILYKLKEYVYAAATVIGFAAAIVTFFLYVSGGVDAPGIFWLAAFPLAMAILLGVRGAIVGYFTVVGVMLFFWYLKANGLGPNVIADHGNYSFEKSFNLIVFLLFSAITTHLYINGEQKYAKKLQEQNNNVENLLRVLLHDVANTLSSMTYNLVKAREDQDLAPANSELDKMERAVADINSLLTQVRHLKSVKDGKTDILFKPISIAFVLNEVFEKIESIANQKGIKLALDLSREKMFVNSEKTILSNVVLLNLLSNAVKFSHPGDRIDLRAYSKDSEAVIEIQDYGVGMPEPLVAQIFSLNARTTRSGTHGEKGTGYGMPLVKEYLQMMGGTIDVSSREEPYLQHPRGTKITLKIPLAQ
ncbi:sensor histidine kinase [Bdellovibrio svalbardensis]|uniref:histidine kinase n=1 Tax=Bdellovibrio svalbardensis TaxID=2972972 RepID=A0ABT6DLI0_9BACT|nr:HAMP domain-containing sensor histidine kinase [Bdellovibrio svalbardensis]MDG0817733.1 HAMP domain-containing histidine kinase [Bdellovibrio svalbardensis]